MVALHGLHCMGCTAWVALHGLHSMGCITSFFYVGERIMAMGLSVPHSYLYIIYGDEEYHYHNVNSLIGRPPNYTFCLYQQCSQ